MMAGLRRAAKWPITAWKEANAPAPVRPIVIIESDDWGRAGLPSLESMETLKAEGMPIGASPWDYYGLESEDDVVQLGDMLSEIRDIEGRPACVTANFIMANADLERMRRENFQEFRWVPIDAGFPAPWRERLMPAYRRNIEGGVFYPGLHGFTHFNTSAMMSLLRQGCERGETLRRLVLHGIPYLASLTPECNFALVDRQHGDERFLSESKQEEWIETGVSLFERAFGQLPLTTCAPGYRANGATFHAWVRHGIRSVQINGTSGISLANGTVILARNVAFEPALAPNFRIEQAVGAAVRAMECGLPVIICSHSVNFMSRFLGRAEEGRRQLAELLRGLLAISPNLRFANDAEVVSAWRANDPAWFRPPTSWEIAARIRSKIGNRIQDRRPPPGEEHESSPMRGWPDAVSPSPSLRGPETVAGAPIARRLGTASLYVLLGNIFTLAVGLPLQIYVARVLGPGGVGVYGLLEAAMTTAVGLLGLGIGQTAMRFVADHLEQGEYGNVRALIRRGGIVLLTAGGAAYLILIALLPWIGALWPELASYRSEAVAMGLMIPLGLLIYFFQQGLRGFQEIRHLVLGSSVVQLSVKAVLAIAAFAIGLRLGGYILASILGMFTAVSWLFYAVWRKTRALPGQPVTASAFPRWYRYAMISYSGALIGAVAAGLDRFLAGAFIGSAAVGVLMIVRQLQNLPERFNQMLLTVGAPLLSAAHSRRQPSQRQHIFCLMTDWSVRCSLPLVLFVLFFGRPVLALYGSAFAADGTVPLQILVAATFFGLLCGPVGNVAMMSGLERQALQVSIAATTLMFIALFLLIPRFGLVGAAAAIALDVVLMNLGIGILDRWLLDLRWWDNRYLAWLPEAGVNVLLAVVVWCLPWRLGAVALLALLLAMYALAILTNIALGLHEEDRDLLRHMWIRLVGNDALA